MGTILIGRTLSSATDSVTVVQGAPGLSPWPMKDFARLVPVPFDAVLLGYNGQGLLSQVVYKTGGVSGTVVATLNITYVNGMIATVART